MLELGSVAPAWGKPRGSGADRVLDRLGFDRLGFDRLGFDGLGFAGWVLTGWVLTGWVLTGWVLSSALPFLSAPGALVVCHCRRPAPSQAGRYAALSAPPRALNLQPDTEPTCR